MPDNEGPTPGLPPDPSGPTQPIRPSQGREPIPERVRQPILVPHQESTIAGLPRAFAVAAVVALVVALGIGFMIGRAVGGDDEAAGSDAGGRGGCGKALSLSIQLVELQKQALVNRTQAAEAAAVDDEAQVRELTAGLAELAPAIEQAEAQVASAVEKCRSARGTRGKGKSGRKGGQDGTPADA